MKKILVLCLVLVGLATAASALPLDQTVDPGSVWVSGNWGGNAGLLKLDTNGNVVLAPSSSRIFGYAPAPQSFAQRVYTDPSTGDVIGASGSVFAGCDYGAVARFDKDGNPIYKHGAGAWIGAWWPFLPPYAPLPTGQTDNKWYGNTYAAINGGVVSSGGSNTSVILEPVAGPIWPNTGNTGNRKLTLDRNGNLLSDVAFTGNIAAAEVGNGDTLDRGWSELRRFDSSGALVGTIPHGVTNYDWPNYSIAVDYRTREVLTVNGTAPSNTSYRVIKVNADFVNASDVAWTRTSAGGVDLHPALSGGAPAIDMTNGDVVYADKGNNRLVWWDKNGAELNIIALGYAPQSVHMNSFEHNVWVMGADSVLRKYDVTGALLAQSPNLNTVYSFTNIYDGSMWTVNDAWVAAAPVPEPVTVSTLALGLALLAVRRR